MPILAHSAIRMNIPKDIIKEAPRKSVLRSLREIKRRFSPPAAQGGIPLLNPVDDIGTLVSDLHLAKSLST